MWRYMEVYEGIQEYITTLFRPGGLPPPDPPLERADGRPLRFPPSRLLFLFPHSLTPHLSLPARFPFSSSLPSSAAPHSSRSLLPSPSLLLSLPSLFAPFSRPPIISFSRGLAASQTPRSSGRAGDPCICYLKFMICFCRWGFVLGPYLGHLLLLTFLRARILIVLVIWLCWGP